MYLISRYVVSTKLSNCSLPDINECLVPGTCSQRCVNRPGGFKCACLKGYLNDPHDRTRCRDGRRRGIQKGRLLCEGLRTVVDFWQAMQWMVT